MKKVDKELLDKFFNNQCSAEEEKKVKAWLSFMKSDFHDMSALEEDWYQFETPKEDKSFWDKELLFEKLQTLILKKEQTDAKPLRKIYSNESQENRPTIPIHTKSKPRFGNYAAVIIAFLVGLATFYYFVNNQSIEEPIAEETLTKYNPKGTKSTITLSDGTVVKLNSESSISFPRRFKGGKRIVKLEGEAFFEVTSDTNRPFIVQTGELEAKVLGTSFNVNTLSDHNKVDIALVTGKLAVYSSTNQENREILLPTESAVFDKTSGKIETGHFDAERVLSWKDGILIFEEAEIEEIITRLERWYACDISFADTANKAMYSKVKFTGKFDNKSLEDVLEGLTLASGLKYQLRNKKVYFY
ncbi:FecR family protein [Chondrinema litorale]|uniref:FecR family protein n=1 Tax=Chondrinema litorale TaxID=2994555 RepID=UPI002542AD77|nr:FecR family protein [Chondrinema litorale]UZR97455.1 FecR domain-containing protein [Chondrinema litorale]